MMKKYYTLNQIKKIAINSGIEIGEISYDSNFKFLRVFTEDNKLFAKQSVSKIKEKSEETYFLCNEFSELM
jgi:hypothetical protein